MPSKDSLGDRMKNYENVNRNYLMRRTPTIIRIDGKAFHNFTRGMEKPFDNILVESMQETMQYLCANIQGCVFGYTQSDEISLLLIDYQNLNSNAWFDYNIQKMTSISASMATLAFDRAYRDLIAERKDIPVSYDFMSTEKQKQYDNRYNIYNKRIGTAMFDSRVFNIPKEEVCNYFIWRQQDATKNAISMVARAYFSHKSLEGLNGNQKQEKLWQEKGINFNNES